MKAKKPTYAQLQQRIIDLEAQSSWRIASTLKDIDKAGDNLFASACVITIHSLGGNFIVKPTAVRDGLSSSTIDAIKADLRRSADGYGYK